MTTATGGQPPPGRFRPEALTRPDPSLLRYYLVGSLVIPPLFPFVFPFLYVRYRTLRYRFDEEGVSMAWGALSRRETFLTYRRVQDIQVTRGVIQRWFGLADVHLHTASGSAGAEMKLEGIVNPEQLRDFLYERMRGGEGEGTGSGGQGGPDASAPRASGEPPVGAPSSDGPLDPSEEALGLLREIRDELRRTRGGT